MRQQVIESFDGEGFPGGTMTREDSHFATVVQTALDEDVWVPNTVTVKMHQGCVTLEGKVSWNFERDAAERTVRDLRAVGKVYNNIVVGH